MITTPIDLEQLAAGVQHAAWLAVDTEADSRHCYFEKLCLMQVSHPQGDYLVDTLAGLDLSPLMQALGGKELILHGADFDLRILRRTVGFVPAAVFDTDIAARLLGVQQTGFSALVEKHFSVHLEKASQKADWAQRPLPEKMVKYAMADTHYLKPLSDILRAELVRLGRLEWLQQCCADLIERSAVTRERDPQMEWRVKGWSVLGGAGLAVLRELWRWRDAEAQAVDRPSFHILNNERLIVIADLASHRKDFHHLLPPRMSPPRRQRLVEAVHRGLQVPPAEYPILPKVPRTKPDFRAMRRAAEIKAVRDARAKELGIDSSLIASRATIEALARDREAKLVSELLLPWQRALLKL
ncbi:MAG: HRDC domain-containing protein [Verrucomicrobia bacterium]|nr:HRDC domain-containing protein [Verrucomicrobiota bacterium]